jgi:hypothetical protein
VNSTKARLRLATIDVVISNIDAKLRGSTTIHTLDANVLQGQYQSVIGSHGKDEPTTIGLGVTFAQALLFSKHTIEAERLLNKLTDRFCQIHGPDHDTTKRANKRILVINSLPGRLCFPFRFFIPVPDLRKERGDSVPVGIPENSGGIPFHPLS